MIVCNLEEYGHNERPVARVPEVAAPALSAHTDMFISDLLVISPLYYPAHISSQTNAKSVYFLQEILSPNMLVST